MSGILPTTIREAPPEERPEQPETVVIDSKGMVSSPGKSNVVIDFPDGSVTISVNAGDKDKSDLKDAKFDANLALSLPESYLGSLAEELLIGIDEDERSRREWLEDRAEGIKLLALKIEKPSSAPQGGASTGVDNTSRSRSTMLLEACLRFQATASGELLPTGGPVKVENKMSRDPIEGDDLAQSLEDDFNYYLTRTASEYVPDTERMLLWTAAGGSGFKKVYRCPIRRRPVSESVDAANLCVSNAATDLANADRVTFKSTMRQSVMKRMQVLKVYRDTSLAPPSLEQLNSVEEQKQEITGVTLSTRPEDMAYTILECYCQINLDGDEHKEKGEITGIPRPYKVTIEKSSRQILEIRRNWRKDDEMERPRETFVKFPFVPGFGFYDLGLFQIMGNPTTAATALLRIGIDAGIFGNFPGGLVAKAMDKQNSTDISVAPGSFAPVDVSAIADGDIRKAVMPLPYKSPDSALFELLSLIVDAGSRLGGVADMSVGEGKQDAPVGTTIAMIEQAIKVIDAVHKRLHNSISKEIELLRNLFIEHPEDFWRFNVDRDPDWDSAKLLKALHDYNLVPRSDPNTSSQVQRILRAQALYQLCSVHPELFQITQCLDYILRAMGITNPASFMAPPTAQPAPPPSLADQAKMLQAQADQTTSQAKMMDAQVRAQNVNVDNANKTQDRNADLKIAAVKLKTEQIMHGQDLQAEAAKQAAEHKHQMGIKSADMQSQAMGLASDHALQAKDHQHDQQTQENQQLHEQVAQSSDHMHERATQELQQEQLANQKPKGSP